MSETTHDSEGREHRRIVVEDARTELRDALTDLQHVAILQGLNPADAALCALRIAVAETDGAQLMVRMEEDEVTITTDAGIATVADIHRNDRGARILDGIEVTAHELSRAEPLPMPGELSRAMLDDIQRSLNREARALVEDMSLGNRELDEIESDAAVIAKKMSDHDARVEQFEKDRQHKRQRGLSARAAIAAGRARFGR